MLIKQLIGPMQNNLYPLHGTCAEAKPICIVLAATPKMIAEAPTNSHTRRVCQFPMDIFVKKICCTRRVPKLCGRTERSSSENKGRGRNTHIRCPQVIAAAIIVDAWNVDSVNLLAFLSGSYPSFFVERA